MSNLPPSSLSYSEVGGSKTDYSAPVNSDTDRSAEEVNAVFCATAQMSRTNPRFWVKFSLVGTTLTLVSWNSSWKGGTITPPVLTHVSTGKLLITLPSTVLDEQGTSHAVNLNAVFASISATTDITVATGSTIFMEPQVLTANTIRIWITNGSSVTSPTNTYITVFAI